MVVPESFKKLDSLINKREKERLEVKDEITAGIHSTIRYFQNNTFVKVFYVESKNRKTFNQYQILLGFPKNDEHIDYINIAFQKLADFTNILKINIEGSYSSMGIEEFDTTRANYYYILFYILKDEKEN